MTGGFDPATPNTARVYSRLLGGKDHFPADRAEADRLLEIYAYDLGTGRAIWRTDLAVFVSREMVTSRGIVVQGVVVGAPDSLQGLRLSDGKATWQAGLPSSCYSGGDSAGTPSAAVFLLVCPSGDRLITIDPADGHISWQRTFAASYPIDLLATSLGDIFAEAGTTMHIFTSSGRTIATRGPPLSCPAGSCSISTGANGPLGVRFELGENSDVFQGINLSTGHVLWQRTAEPVENPFVALDSDGILFGITVPYRFGIGGPYGLLPDFVLTMQASTGRSTVLPLPLAGSVIAGTTANLLIVLSQGGRNAVITALRAEDSAMSGPAVLGGVTPATWPDACKLLMPADLRFIAAGYVPVPRTVTMPGVTWRKPVTCAYIGPGTGDPAVTLTVAWIAASNQQEDELLGSYLRFLSGISPGPPLRIPGGYLVYDRTVAGGVDQALIAAGRAIVTVTVPGHPGDARRLAPLVAARLRAAYGTG